MAVQARGDGGLGRDGRSGGGEKGADTGNILKVVRERGVQDDCFGPERLGKHRCCYWWGKTGRTGRTCGGGGPELGLHVLNEGGRAGGSEERLETSTWESPAYT